MTNVDAGNAHEQNVTMSLRLNVRAERLALRLVMVFVVGMCSLVVTADVLREYFDLQLTLFLPLVILGIITILMAFSFVKAFKAASAFDKEHEQAFKDGQQLRYRTSFYKQERV